MALDLLNAAIDQLRATEDVVAAFGDTWAFDFPGSTSGTGISKFSADFAPDVAEPYLVFFETFENYEYQTHQAGNYRPFIATGQFGCEILAPGRYQARQLGFLVAGALNDVALVWPGQQLMLLRLSSAAFAPIKDAGPGVATTFKRVLIFDYQYSGGL